MHKMHGEEGYALADASGAASVERSRILGQVIRERRQELGLTQEELAALVGHGVRQAEISRLEHDRVGLPRRARLENIANALGFSVGQLLAQSGWVGADTAIVENHSHAAPDMDPDSSEDVSNAVRSYRERTTTNADAFAWPEAERRNPALFEAIQEAQQTISRTAEVIRESKNTVERFSRRRGRHA
jgi:transcriptional regulator with XRE-family HTH domain